MTLLHPLQHRFPHRRRCADGRRTGRAVEGAYRIARRCLDLFGVATTAAKR
ncbi:MAG: hypothetical protein ACLGIG_07090 [Actinomycetes bacterium]